jgi:pimeloyl-ACP methyl ester carboxylesterase
VRANGAPPRLSIGSRAGTPTMTHAPMLASKFPSLRARDAGRAAALLAVAGLAFTAAGLARRLSRELFRFRTAGGILYRRWTRIPAVAGSGTLRIHSRLRDVMTNADPLVLVHGFGIGSSYFVPLAARLSHHAPVYAPDLPGHGPSDHDARPLTVAELAQALASWMEAMGLRGAVVVGHSLGCQVALHLAASRPELASRLVLIGPTADRSTRSVDDRPERLAPRVQCPVAVVRGERDRISSQRWAERLAHAAGAPDPIVVPGWGHAVHYDDPETLSALIVGLGIPTERERRQAPYRPGAGAFP